MSLRLEGKRVLLTQAADYMDPAIYELFSSEGAVVHAMNGPVPGEEQFTEYTRSAGDVDIVIANLAHDRVPINRVAEVNESAELALFLASDKSHFIVGQVVPFSGGWATNV